MIAASRRMMSVSRLTQLINTTATQTLRTRAEHYTTTAGNRPEHPEPQRDTGLDMPTLVTLLRQENASDICVIRLAPELLYTDHMIIASAASPRHLSAMATLALKAFKFLRTDEQRHTRMEGRDCSDWKTIDCGSVVLHLMLPETRSVYELEKLWTLRSHDEQLQQMPTHTLPPDFIWDGQL